MVWNEPPTKVVGDMATSADWNEFVRDNEKATYHAPFAFIDQTVAQSIPNATQTYVVFNDLPTYGFGPWDNYGMVDLSSGTTDRVNIIYSGFYHVSAQVAWDSNPTGPRVHSLWTDTIQFCKDTRLATGDSESVFGHYTYLNAGQYVRLAVYQVSGGALNAKECSLAVSFRLN